MNLKRILVNRTGKYVNINKYLIIKEARASKDYNNFCGKDIWTKRIYSAFKKLYDITHISDFERIFQIDLSGRAYWDVIEEHILKNFPNQARVVIDNE